VENKQVQANQIKRYKSDLLIDESDLTMSEASSSGGEARIPKKIIKTKKTGQDNHDALGSHWRLTKDDSDETSSDEIEFGLKHRIVKKKKTTKKSKKGVLSLSGKALSAAATKALDARLAQLREQILLKKK
jgi:hypothetical protein